MAPPVLHAQRGLVCGGGGGGVYEGLGGRLEELVSGDALGCCCSSGVLSACSDAMAADEYLHLEELHSQVNSLLLTSQKWSP